MDCKSAWAKIKTFLSDERVMAGLWALVGILSAVTKMSVQRHNNYLIYKGVFWHVWHQLPLFAEYPLEYGDINHYGPLFSLIIAPFALLPDWAGLILWNTALAMLLYWAIRQLQLTRYQHIFMLWFCAHELLTALFMQQFNVATVALILLSFAFVRQEKDIWATLAIVIGTLVKLYGIVGLAFFFFSRHKGKYILSLIGWTALLFALPMVISSPEYICSTYQEWLTCLMGKNSDNLLSLMQNISLLGIIRKVGVAVSGAAVWHTYSDLWVILPGLLLFFAPYVRLKQYGHLAFQQTLLASVLMFVCLFSTGTESSSYIIALVGVVLWFTAAPWQRTKWDIALMVFCFILTSLSPSDLFPAYIRHEWVQPYALKALPVAIIWFQLTYEMLTRSYEDML
ncbi:MAG: DUF2029 domain-containing protein [Paludibacteraceae bacterium]|nr:DUF2029 domain-containing protein [Paludibacteraceae bacterium]